MSFENPNVAKCVTYLRSMGIDVTGEQETAWLAQESAERARRRAHRRELKQSCGHFSTHWCAIYHADGRTDVRYCNDCGAAVEYRGTSLLPPAAPRAGGAP